MLTLTSIPEMVDRSVEWRRAGKIIGFVPTMGALHEGHLSLVRASAMECDATVVSIFVNPTQFGPGEDYERYPRRSEEDAALLDATGCEVMLYLDREAMYPPGYQTWVEVEHLSKPLCGRFRPGHFRGVCTVVAKLFNIVRPHRAYFGWKDAQQGLVLRRMNEDLNFGIEIVLAPIVRDRDGLALSSRNCYLTEGERRAALAIPRAIRWAREYYRKGGRDAPHALRRLRALFEDLEEARVEYIALKDLQDLADADRISRDTLLALAVRVGSTRLIDNHRFSEDEPCSDS